MRQYKEKWWHLNKYCNTVFYYNFWVVQFLVHCIFFQLGNLVKPETNEYCYNILFLWLISDIFSSFSSVHFPINLIIFPFQKMSMPKRLHCALENLKLVNKPGMIRNCQWCGKLLHNLSGNGSGLWWEMMFRTMEFSFLGDWFACCFWVAWASDENCGVMLSPV